MKTNKYTSQIMEVLAVLLIIAFIALTGCEQQGSKVEVYMREGYLNKLEVEFLDDVKAVDAKYIEIQKIASDDSIEFEELKYNESRFGFHVDWGNRTVIYIVRPGEIPFKDFSCHLGHEMSHELFGEFHKPNQKITKLKIKLPKNTLTLKTKKLGD